jgi:DNA-binding NarL/FixJ family response regulator
MSAGPRVIIVDADHRVRQSLTDLLRIAGAEVVGSAGDVRSALNLISAETPDVALLDPRLPDVEAGAALLKGIKLGWPRMRVVVMGWSDPLEQPGVLSGVSGYVPKSASADDFLAAALAACG